VREQLAENVRIEARVLIAIADHMAGDLEGLAQRRVEHLLDPDADLAALPKMARDHIATYHATDDAGERRALRQRMLQRAAQILRTEEETLRQRASDLREHMATVVDERLEALRQQLPDHDERPRRGRRP
jgi:hypothetical protein